MFSLENLDKLLREPLVLETIALGQSPILVCVTDEASPGNTLEGIASTCFNSCSPMCYVPLQKKKMHGVDFYS